MSSSLLQVQNKEFIPSLPKIEPRQLGGMGKIIRWVRNSRSESFIYRITVLSLSIIASMVLLTSIVFSPIAIWGCVEFTRQDEEAKLIKFKSDLVHAGIEHSEYHFKSGRLTPTENARLSIGRATRKRMLHDLELGNAAADTVSNRDLIQKASLKFPNYLERYDLTISSPFHITDYFPFRTWPLNRLVF